MRYPNDENQHILELHKAVRQGHMIDPNIILAAEQNKECVDLDYCELEMMVKDQIQIHKFQIPLKKKYTLKPIAEENSQEIYQH